MPTGTRVVSTTTCMTKLPSSFEVITEPYMIATKIAPTTRHRTMIFLKKNYQESSEVAITHDYDKRSTSCLIFERVTIYRKNQDVIANLKSTSVSESLIGLSLYIQMQKNVKIE